jgi:dimethylargininase
MKALVRRPGPRLAEGIVTHIDRRPVDRDLAERQWQEYVAALAGHGWEPVEVAPAPDCPDSVFVEDMMVVLDGTAVIARPGADARRAEVEEAERAVRDLGYDVVRIEPPGTLDGGDVLKIGRRVHVGLGGRTNAEGARQLAALLEPLGAEVVAVPVRKVLHLKSGVTALPDGTVVGYEPLVDDVSAYERFLAVPEEPGAHVVVLDDRTVLMAADAPESAAMFRDRGWETVTVDISEYEKLEGCVTCLSVRLRDLP